LFANVGYTNSWKVEWGSTPLTYVGGTNKSRSTWLASLLRHISPNRRVQTSYRARRVQVLLYHPARTHANGKWFSTQERIRVVTISGLLPLSENLFDICREEPTFHLVNIVNVTTHPLAAGLNMCTCCAQSWSTVLCTSGPLSVVELCVVCCGPWLISQRQQQSRVLPTTTRSTPSLSHSSSNRMKDWPVHGRRWCLELRSENLPLPMLPCGEVHAAVSPGRLWSSLGINLRTTQTMPATRHNRHR